MFGRGEGRDGEGAVILWSNRYIQATTTTTKQQQKKKEKKAYLRGSKESNTYIVQELCESRGGRPGMSVLMSILVSVDVKIY